MKEIALLGTTASGKTALSLDIADKFDSVILSLDSLSIYKEIDIASAKPTKTERGDIIHFGIDEIFPNEHFSSADFLSLYKKAKNFAKNHGKNLIIVGGTSFYLKSIIDGLSTKPKIDKNIKQKIEEIKKSEAYEIILKNDPLYASKISKNDSYRIEKWLEIFFSTGENLSSYFKKNRKISSTKNIKIFEITTDRDLLKKRVEKRTLKMIEDGLIDEVFYLEKRYTREPKPLKAIGIKETFEYLDGKISIEELPKKITTSTMQLAKRQKTFNKSQFKNVTRGDTKTLSKEIKSYILHPTS